VCTILLAWRCLDDADIVIAANRDELVERQSAPPMVLHESPRIAGGKDLVAGGTWLAVRQDGAVCAVTNRRLPDVDEVVRDPNRRSRGEIPLQALTSADESGLPAFLEALGPGRYNPVNVLVVSPRFAIVASVNDTGPPRVTQLQPGLHVLTVGDVDDEARPKDAALRDTAGRALLTSTSSRSLETRWRSVLSQHETPTGDPLDAACIHGDVYGTVSSSTLIVAGSEIAHRHAPARPCVTPFALVTALRAA